LPQPVDPTVATAVRNRVVSASRKAYGTPRSTHAELSKHSSEQHPPSEGGTPVVPTALKKAEALSPAVSLPSESQILAFARAAEHQHEVLKNRIQSAAEKLGFEVEREKQLGSKKRIDLVLTGQRVRIACEVARTTTAQWELGNVTKCFEEVFTHVAVISSTTDRLVKIRDEVLAALPAQEIRQVRLFQTDEFINWLQRFALTPTSERPKVRTKKRNFNFGGFSKEEQKQIEAHALKELEKFMALRRENNA